MEITYDEFIVRCQSSDFKEHLDAKIRANDQTRYSRRMSGVGPNPNSRTELYNMTEEHFKSLRSYQMAQLLEGYRKANSFDYYSLIRIRPGETKPDEIRSVIGDHPNYISHDGAMALDYDTIQAVQYISTLIGDGYSYGKDPWKKSIDRYSLEKIVDEMIAVKSILVEQTKMPYQEAESSKIYRETDLVKRAIGKVQSPYDKKLYYYPSSDKDSNQSGFNVFGIKDFELTLEELLKRKTNKFSKISRSLSTAVKNLLFGKDEKEEARMGNKTIDIGGRD